MRITIVEAIDSAIDRFQGVVELKSADINAKSNEKLTAIGVQLAAPPNCKGLRNQVFCTNMETGWGLWQINNLVLDIDGKGRNILVEDAIGETTGDENGQFAPSNHTAKIPCCEAVAEGPSFIMTE